MQIDLIAVGKRMPAWIETAVKEYSKRLPKNIQFKIVEIAPALRGKNNNVEYYKKKEQENIELALNPKAIIIALDERGESMSSEKLANQLQAWNDEQQHISIIIGGADGLADEIKKNANHIWALSRMTMPHGLARVMLVEQIYRAWAIIQSHPYHRK